MKSYQKKNWRRRKEKYSTSWELMSEIKEIPIENEMDVRDHKIK